MTDKLEDTANQALMAIIDNAATAKEFILAELPEVVQQLLIWRIADNVLWILYDLAIIATLLWMFSKMLPKYKAAFRKGTDDETDFPESEANFWYVAGGVVHFIITAVLFFKYAPTVIRRTGEIIQVSVAPKVYLLEYASSLVQ